MIAWSDLSRAPVVNRPALMAANNSKPYQLSLIAHCGFGVPDTLVTTDEAAVRAFQERHGALIYKSVSGVRSIVARLDDAKAEVLADVANCPTQFQQYIPGLDIRVHVVGERVIATQITSAANDYRYASRAGSDIRLEPVTLPSAISERCWSLAREMGLYFAGIDFRRTPDDVWYCLEVNPSPGFTFFEAATGQPIAAAVADLLLQLDRSALARPPQPSARSRSRSTSRKRGSG